MRDQDVLLHGVIDMQEIAAQYLELGPGNVAYSIEQLLGILERQDVAAATNRLSRGARQGTMGSGTELKFQRRMISGDKSARSTPGVTPMPKTLFLKACASCLRKEKRRKS